MGLTQMNSQYVHIETKDYTIYDDKTLNRQRILTMHNPRFDMIQPLVLNAPLIVQSVSKLYKNIQTHFPRAQTITSPVLFDHQSNTKKKTNSEFNITLRADKQKILTDDKLEVRNVWNFVL